jgi:phage-related minor tail protein
MPGKSTTLVIRILADASQAQSTMSKAASNSGKFASGLSKATLPAAAVIGGLTLMGKAAAEDAQGQAVLATSLRKSAGASQKQIASVEDWVSATTLATGVADDKLRPALGTLARATGDVTKSQAAMTTVLDVSAATGKDTQSVADALAKAYSGSTTALGKLVPGMDKAVLKSGDMNAIMAELARMTGGTAAEAADTAAGKWQRTKVAFAETQESIGAGLLPVLDKFSGYLAIAGGWMSQHTQTVTVFAVALGILSVAVLTVNTAIKVISATTKAWSVAQGILNVVMSLNPIGLVILAVIALVAIFVIAYKKSETFRRIVQAAWSGIKTAAVAAWNWIKRYVIDPFMAGMKALWTGVVKAAGGIAKAWDAIKKALKTVWDWIYNNVIKPWIDAFDKVVGAVQKVIDWIKKIKIPSAIAKLFGGKAAPTVMVTSPAPAPASAVARRRRGRAAPTPSGRGVDADALPTVVNVYLDGNKVGGYVDRVITRRLDAEGARLAAGAWR